MQVASSIQIPKRVDPKRKLLVKQLQNDIRNIKKQNISTPKRKPSQDHDEYQNMDTLKKKQHMDQSAIRNGKQNHRTQKQNDRLFAQNKSHEIPFKPPINPQGHFQNHPEELTQNDRTVRKQDTFALPNIPVLFPMMLDQSIPNLKDPNLGIFTDKQRLLITVQQKLDSYLLFVKENRKKKKGQFFSLIKKSFLQNQRIFLEFSHIKKILFVDSDLYKVQKFGQGVSIDCIIDIKLKCNDSDTKALQLELRQRKNTFPNKLLAVKEELKNTTGQQKVEIPEVKFEFESTVSASKTVMKKSLKNILDDEMMNKKKIDKFFVLQSKDSAEYQMAKKILLTGIKRVETIIQKETQIDLKLFEKKLKQQKQLNQKQVESLIQEVNFVYRSKGVTNLLFDLLIEALSKKLIMSLEVLRKCIDIFIQVGPKINNLKPFLRSINHKSGRIIQMERGSIDDFRNSIVKNQEWMNNFKFDLEMSSEQVRKKMEAERIKVFQEVKDIAFDEVVSQDQALKPKQIETNEETKIDFSQVRPFIEKPIKQKIDENFSQQEESEDENEEIGIPKTQYDETLKIIKEQRQIAIKARREIRMAANKKIDELMGIQSPEKKKKSYKKKEKLQKKEEIIQMENDELPEDKKDELLHEKKDESTDKKDDLHQIQYKQQFKSTLSNSDEIFYHEDEPIKEQNYQ